jgi:hypothetical protein
MVLIFQTPVFVSRIHSSSLFRAGNAITRPISALMTWKLVPTRFFGLRAHWLREFPQFWCGDFSSFQPNGGRCNLSRRSPRKTRSRHAQFPCDLRRNFLCNKRSYGKKTNRQYNTHPGMVGPVKPWISEFLRFPTSAPRYRPSSAAAGGSFPLKALLFSRFLLRWNGGPGHDAIVTTVDQSGIRVLGNALSDPSGASSVYVRASRLERLGPRMGRGFPRSVHTSWTGPPLRRFGPTRRTSNNYIVS